jgi:hypothetical protein
VPWIKQGKSKEVLHFFIFGLIETTKSSWREGTHVLYCMISWLELPMRCITCDTSIPSPVYFNQQIWYTHPPTILLNLPTSTCAFVKSKYYFFEGFSKQTKLSAANWNLVAVDECIASEPWTVVQLYSTKNKFRSVWRLAYTSCLMIGCILATIHWYIQLKVFAPIYLFKEYNGPWTSKRKEKRGVPCRTLLIAAPQSCGPAGMQAVQRLSLCLVCLKDTDI